MKKEFYHQSIKFNKTEPAYLKLLKLQESMLDPTGRQYPLTSIIKMSIMAFNDKNCTSPVVNKVI